MQRDGGRTYVASRAEEILGNKIGRTPEKQARFGAEYVWLNE